MSGQLRVCCHTDGRVAIKLGSDPWCIVGYLVGNNVSGDDWSELFVTELPDPDGWTNTVGDDGENSRTPYWTTRRGTVTAWTDGVDDDWGLNEEISGLRVDALKMLAAIAACERYRAEREA